MKKGNAVHNCRSPHSACYLGAFSLVLLVGCATPPPGPRVIPSLEYSRRISEANQASRKPFQSQHHARMSDDATQGAAMPAPQANKMPQVRFVDGTWDSTEHGSGRPTQKSAIVSNEIPGVPADDSGYSEYRASMSDSAPYVGPLTIGEPGVTASLWGESRPETDMFRDHRAFQPMDLITIVVSENAEGEKEADTETKSSTDVSASIKNFLGLEKYLTQANKNIDLESLISAETENNFKGEGSTSRKDSLQARISAMVVEVLPSGILRVEGEKIIAVNSEEQIMVISGLIRTRDINSENEVSSAKIANMRIDYYGKGVVAEGQYGGWLGRALRILWPF